jgi:hypothetical protein
MKESAEGLAADLPVAPAANESFIASGDALDTHAYQRPGWDPYEVWRTRVKAPAANAPAKSGHKRARDPLTDPRS